MGRKKKKGSLESKQNSSVLSAENDSIGSQRLLELTLVTSRSIKGTPAHASITLKQNEALISLSEQDAKDLHVQSRDIVIILSLGGSGSVSVVKAAALCRACVDSQSKSGSTSHQSRRSKLSGGYCHIEPPALADRIVSNCVEPSQRNMLPQTQLTKKDCPTTPNTERSSFSFARGGGGDIMFSPSTPATTPLSTPSKNTNTKKKPVSVIPLNSLLGAEIYALLARDDAVGVSFVPKTELSVGTSSKTRSLLQRLLIASCKGRLIAVGDIIYATFRGQKVEFEVASVRRRISEVDQLTSELAGLELERRAGGEADILRACRNGLSMSRQAVRVMLYKISDQTEAEIANVANPDQSSVEDSHVKDKTESVVAGMDSTIQQLKSILLPPLLHPEIFSVKPPRGVLIYGPSGVGKSTLVDQIAIDLKKICVRVLCISCVSLQSHTTIVGEAERELSRTFRRAESGGNENGTLLVLDDIHLICSNRGAGSTTSDRLAATLLALLDGIAESRAPEAAGSSRMNLVVLAVTSDPSILDPALRRPGRLDVEIEVPIPDEPARTSILRFQLEKIHRELGIKCSLSNEDISGLSRLAKGFNGADCMLAIKEALRTGMTASNPEEVTMAHLQAAIRSTKPSTIKSISVEIPRVPWTSIGGMDGVKQMLWEAIELPLVRADLFNALSIPPPRGLLLYGPPGCSKTLMARALATQGQMNFLAVKGPELLSKWLGESERALASLFRRARMAGPCIVFFDEIDAIASKRGESANSGGERLLSQLLTELDGIKTPDDTKHRVVVVGATNRPDLLDSALVRPGRIDRMIYVGLPDRKSRQKILEIGLEGKACSHDVDIPLLADDRYTGGFSGAEVISVCREAALLAIEAEHNFHEICEPVKISMKHLILAANGVQPQVTQETLDFYLSFQVKNAAA